MVDTHVTVTDLVKRHRGARTNALDGVSFDIPSGESLGLVGPNGAGKTTLLGCLLGLLRPDGGSITIGARPPDDLAIRALTGYVPERPLVLPGFSARRLLDFHHTLAGLPKQYRDLHVNEALGRVALDDRVARRPLRTLSRGLLQRVGIAQSLLGAPRFVVFDEAASGLDPGGILLFMDLVAQLRKQGATVIMSSHQLDQIDRCCDRVFLIRDGRIHDEMRTGASSVEAMFRNGDPTCSSVS